MTYVLTLIANPTISSLDERIINSVFRSLEKKAGPIEKFQWLSLNEACDIYFQYESPEPLSLDLSKHPIDYAIQPQHNRRKKLLISDMDSTMIEQECIDELADALGIKAQVAEITTKAMNNELDFKEALRHRVALLKGLDETELERVYNQHITLMPGAQTLIRTMRHRGAYCLLVSGGFTYFTQRIADRLGFHDHHANILEIENRKLIGKVREPILDKESKLKSLINATKTLGISTDDVIAIGDGANDIPMLQAAGLGVAFQAHENVQKQMKICINHGNLESLLYLQGYTKAEFAVD